jgi:hypothetical protein
MDTSDLQKLIEVIAAQLRVDDTPEESGSGDSVSTSLGSGDPARVVAELVAAIPVAPVVTPSATPVIRASKSEDPSPVSRVARSLVTGPGVASFIKGLFGRGEDSPVQLPPVTKFQLPLPVREDVAYSSRTGEYLPFDRSANGTVRANQDVSLPAITVNVQAMDSKSFLDHSDDIARAVREAMLNSHSLNDVVSEL